MPLALARYFSIAAAAAATLLWSRDGRADDGSDVARMLEEEVVVSASRRPELATAAPSLSRTISADELREFGIRTLDEALDFLAMGVRANRRLDGRVDVGARGAFFSGDQGSHLLLSVDGHVLNDPLYGSAPFGVGLGIPIEMIDHIEVILGPGSVVYGSNAMLGVVNVVTKSPREHEGVHAAVEVTPVSAGRASVSAGYAIDTWGKPLEIVAGATYYRQDGPDFDLTPQHTGIDPANGKPDRWSRLDPASGVWGGTVRRDFFGESPGLYAHLVRDRVELIARYAGYRYGEPTAVSSFDEPLNQLHDQQTSVSLRYRQPLGARGEVAARAFVDVYSHDERWVVSRASWCPLGSGSAVCEFPHEYGSRRVGVEVTGSFEWTLDGRLVTMVGGTAQTSEGHGTDSFLDFNTGRPWLPTGKIIPEASFLLVAGSASQVWQPTRWLTLNAGARVDKDERFPAVLSPRAVVAVEPWSGGTLKAIFARAFRAPSIFETQVGGEGTLRANSLLPEQVESREAVLEQRAGVHRLSLGIFSMEYDDGIRNVALTSAEEAAAFQQHLIVVNSNNGVGATQARNVDRIRTVGFTLGGDGALLGGRLHYGASFSGAFAKEEPADLPPDTAPRAFGNARLSYALGGPLPTVAAAFSFTTSSLVKDAVETGYGYVSAPAQGDLRLTLSGKVPRVARLSYRIIGSHAHTELPFLIGPSMEQGLGQTKPALEPVVPRTTATVGLQYDF